MERVESNKGQTKPKQNETATFKAERESLSLPELVQDALRKGLSGELSSLTIQFKDECICGLELVKLEPVKKKLSEILREDAYQTLEVKKHEDRISYIRKSVFI